MKTVRTNRRTVSKKKTRKIDVNETDPPLQACCAAGMCKDTLEN